MMLRSTVAVNSYSCFQAMVAMSQSADSLRYPVRADLYESKYRLRMMLVAGMCFPEICDGINKRNFFTRLLHR